MLNPDGYKGAGISNAGSPALLSASSSLINTPTLEIKK